MDGGKSANLGEWGQGVGKEVGLLWEIWIFFIGPGNTG